MDTGSREHDYRSAGARQWCSRLRSQGPPILRHPPSGELGSRLFARSTNGLKQEFVLSCAVSGRRDRQNELEQRAVPAV